MESVAARLCDQAEVGAAIAPVGRIIESCLNLEFLYAIGIWNRNSAASGSAALHIAHANPVHLEIIVIGACSMDVKPII